MNGAELHLILNHLPVSATFFGILVLLGGMLFRNNSVKKVGFILLIFAGLATLPTVSTGEEAEEIIENMGFGEEVHDLIHEHEEMAETARWISLGVGILALLAFYFHQSKKAPAKFFAVLTLVGGVGSMIYLINVADAGGKITHTEMHDDFVVPHEEID